MKQCYWIKNDLPISLKLSNNVKFEAIPKFILFIYYVYKTSRQTRDVTMM